MFSIRYPSLQLVIFDFDALFDDEGHDQAEHQQHDGDGAGIAVLEVGEALLIEPGGKHLGAVVGAALGHVVDQIEEFEGADAVEGEGGDEHRFDEGQCNMQERLRLGGAVDVGGLIQIARDAGDLGHVEHHVLADVLPEGHEGDDDHGQDDEALGVHQPERTLDAEGGEHLVEAHLGVEHERPQQAERCAGENGGQIVDVFEGVAALFDVGEQHGQQQTEDLLGDGREEEEEDRVFQRDHHDLIAGEHLNIIFESHENGGRERVVVAEGIVRHLQDGNKKYHGEQDDRRQNK